jgi:hypothetical protein
MKSYCVLLGLLGTLAMYPIVYFREYPFTLSQRTKN